MVRTLLRKAVFDRRIYLQNFASQSCLRQPHLSLRFTGQSILLRKTVYCQNFATQNRLFRTLLRKVVFDHRIMVKAFCYAKRSATAPFSSGCILCGSLASAVFAVFDRPVFLRGAYFAVHKRFNLNFIKLFRRNSFGKYN